MWIWFVGLQNCSLFWPAESIGLRCTFRLQISRVHCAYLASIIVCDNFIEVFSNKTNHERLRKSILFKIVHHFMTHGELFTLEIWGRRIENWKFLRFWGLAYAIYQPRGFNHHIDAAHCLKNITTFCDVSYWSGTRNRLLDNSLSFSFLLGYVSKTYTFILSASFRRGPGKEIIRIRDPPVRNLNCVSESADLRRRRLKVTFQVRRAQHVSAVMTI